MVCSSFLRGHRGISVSVILSGKHSVEVSCEVKLYLWDVEKISKETISSKLTFGEIVYWSGVKGVLHFTW